MDCIVFWTKNPEPLLSKIEELAGYHYYFQFTLTPYGSDVEGNVPHRRAMIPIFQKLSRKIGKERVIWRYDPILFTDYYTPEIHLKLFEETAKELQGFTSQCVISFVDVYAKNAKNLRALKPIFLTDKELKPFAEELSRIACKFHMKVAACAEAVDLSSCGIGRSCCIDKKMIEQIIGCKIWGGKDKNQRRECGCMESIEVGAYNTCRNECKYCYANHSLERVIQNCSLYDAHSPLLCGKVTEADKVTERNVASLKENQLSIWDL